MTYQKYDSSKYSAWGEIKRRKQLEYYKNLRKSKLEQERQLQESIMKNFKSRVFKKICQKIFNDIILPILIFAVIIAILIGVAFMLIYFTGLDWRLAGPASLFICVGIPFLGFGAYDIYVKAKKEVEAENAKLMRDLKGDW